MPLTGDSDRIRRLTEENQRLQRAVEELSVLNELAREIGASRDSKEIMERIVRRSIHALAAEQGVITLVDEEAIEPTRTLVRTNSSSGAHQPMRANQQLLGWMHLHREPVLISEPQTDARFSGAGWNEDVRSVLCVPLLARSRLIGILTVFNKKSRAGFTAEDQRLLTIIAAQSAQVVENARLYEEERALVKVRQELRVAAEIQRRLLPQSAPVLPGYELAGLSRPAENVGGDFFDFLTRADGSVGVCVADVSGKGLPAALLMANVQAALRVRHLEDDDPTTCLVTLSRLLYETTSKRSFVSMVYGIIDPTAHTLTYANAGQNRPLLCGPDGTVSRLDTAGIVLGAVEHARYRRDEARLESGAVLLLYSDGVSEAMNERREEFGEELLTESLRVARSGSADAVLDLLTQKVAAHVGTARQHDDMTLLVVKRVA